MSQSGPSIDGSVYLPPHRLKVALLQPQIAPNTGNIARLCVATGAELHLVRPLGFLLNDRQLKRRLLGGECTVSVERGKCPLSSAMLLGAMALPRL